LIFRLAVFPLVAGQSVVTKAWAMEQLPGRLDQFVFGMLAAHVLVRWRASGTAGYARGERQIGPALIVSGLAGVVIFQYLLDAYFLEYWDGHPLLFVWHGCVGFCMAALICGVATNCALGRVLFGNRFMLATGVVSYSLYLWHGLLMEMLGRWPALAGYQGYRLPSLLLCAVPVSFAVAALSYRFIERPFLDWQNRRAPSAFVVQPATGEEVSAT
jgi:peptidoglycan/LPS O-acetylase OafA/YrhL